MKTRNNYSLSLGILDSLNHELPEINSITKRFYHSYIVGKTGMGKSTLLERMALYDINFGSSVIFIDPSGLSCRKLYHKTKDKDRVTYISIDNPTVINPMDKEGYRLDTVIQEFVQILDILVSLGTSNVSTTVLMREIINMAMRSITRPQDRNIEFLTNLLMYKNKRDELRNSPELGTAERTYWEEFDVSTSKRSEAPRNKERVDSAKRVASRLLEISTGEMRDFVIGKNELDITDIVENSKVVLVDTSRMNENSKIYLTNLLVYAVLSYSEHSDNKYRTNPKPLIVYVDEFAIVVSKLFATLLASTRKSGVGFVLAHQNFSQIPDRILDTILGNVHTTICFRCGDTEARRFSSIYDIKMQDLFNLEEYNAWIRIGVDNIRAEIYPPIMKDTPPLPKTVLNPKPVNPTDKQWFLADEWISV